MLGFDGKGVSDLLSSQKCHSVATAKVALCHIKDSIQEKPDDPAIDKVVAAREYE